MKYKVGDRVKVKSLEWYNENIDSIDEVVCGNTNFIPDMTKYCEGIITISSVLPTLEVYHIKEDGGMFNWTDEMIEGLVKEETKPKFKVGDKVITNKGYVGKFEGWVSDYQVRVLFEESGDNVVIHPKNLKLVEDEIIDLTSIVMKTVEDKTIQNALTYGYNLPDGYIFKDENGNVINATKIVLEKKKKEYPKTYEECLKVLNIEGGRLCFNNSGITQYERDLYIMMNNLSKLLICRDAYWKIAGEEMGLGKPNWEDENQEKYIIGSWLGTIQCLEENFVSHPFAFPTEEMRDAFKENFDPDIEICKEFL